MDKYLTSYVRKAKLQRGFKHSIVIRFWFTVVAVRTHFTSLVRIYLGCRILKVASESIESNPLDASYPFNESIETRMKFQFTSAFTLLLLNASASSFAACCRWANRASGVLETSVFEAIWPAWHPTRTTLSSNRCMGGVP